ncbi:MAG TPA: hypothetical protein VFR96_14690 [Povalibacter sp.]|jgi:hypothetical protein|nr:hypothetical protein [Povalibacter sp.]
MFKLLQTFIDIAIWRKGPQDLPSSRFLAVLVLCVYVIASFAQIVFLDLRMRSAVVVIAVDVLMMMTWLWAVLAFFGYRQRFLQTFSAMLGVGVLLAVVDIGVRALQLLLDGPSHGLPTAWLALRFFLIALVMGRILMQALDRGLLTGMALTVAIVYSTGAVAQAMVTRLHG